LERSRARRRSRRSARSYAADYRAYDVHGLGPKDALTLPRNSAKGGEIAITRSKDQGTGFLAPAGSPLAAILTSAPPHAATTLCANSKGLPWTMDGFRASWLTFAH